MLSYVFFIFFLFFLSKSCCTVVFWALQLGISNLLSQEKKKARENIFSSKCVNSKVVWRVFFFSLCFWRQIQIDLFVFRLFLSISFFSSPQPSQWFVCFADFSRIIFLFFYYSLSDFGSFSSFSSESSALPLLDLLLSSVATAFLTEWKMRFLT